jgi:excisionase family DNA binding protein
MNGKARRTNGTMHAVAASYAAQPQYPEILLPEEAAAFLRVHPDTLSEAMHNQGLPYNKIASKIVLEKSAIHRWLEENRIREFAGETTRCEPFSADMSRYEPFSADVSR